jgi:hypothetical protein
VSLWFKRILKVMTQSSGSNPRAWRPTAPAPPGGKPPSTRRGKFLALLALFLALAGTIAGLIKWIRPVHEPSFLAIWVDQYEDPRIPVNSWAGQDRQALLNVHWQEKNAFASQLRARLVSELRALEEKGDRPLVVYLNAHALTGDDGQVYVLPGDARLDEPATWLALGEVLRSLRACRSRDKLLILDVMYPCIEPRAGVLANDVPSRAQSAIEAALSEDRNLQVLCACSPGQVALASEDLRRSVFGYYLEQGLSGRAEGYNEQGSSNGRVSVRELATFVKARVDRWAEQNGEGCEQTPLLLAGPAAGDFPLVAVGAGPAAQESPAPEPYPDWLRAGWTLRDEWWGGMGPRVPIPLYRELDEALLRAERHWRGGTDQAHIQTFLDAPLQRFRRQRDDLAAEAARSAPRSLAEEVARGASPPDLAAEDILLELRKLAELDAQVRARAEKGNLPAQRERFLKSKTFQGKPFNLAWAVFEAACAERSPRPEQVLFWNDLLLFYWREVLRANPARTPYAETQYLERLADLPRKFSDSAGARDWPAEAVRAALWVVRTEEQVAAGDPQALPWVEAWRRSAARQRREGEKVLFGSTPDPEQAGRLLAQALREYELAYRYLRTIQEAQRLRDEALALLPGYLPYLESGAGDGRAWEEAVSTAKALRDALAGPPGPDAPPPADLFNRIEGLTEALQEGLARLRKPFEPGKLAEVIRLAPEGGPSAARQVDALLSCSWLKAGDRAALWKTGRELSGRLLRKTLDLDQAEDGARKRTEAPPASDSEKAGRLEWQQALRRAEWSVTLLKLEGPADLKELEGALARTRADPANPAGWQEVRRELRRAWAHEKMTR